MIRISHLVISSKSKLDATKLINKWTPNIRHSLQIFIIVKSTYRNIWHEQHNQQTFTHFISFIVLKQIIGFTKLKKKIQKKEKTAISHFC